MSRPTRSDSADVDAKLVKSIVEEFERFARLAESELPVAEDAERVLGYYEYHREVLE